MFDQKVLKELRLMHNKFKTISSQILAVEDEITNVKTYHNLVGL
jgi:hypothetical protein